MVRNGCSLHWRAITDSCPAFLFKPNLPFMKKSTRRAPFFGLQDSMPVVLALLLGFQHALAMLAGVSKSVRSSMLRIVFSDIFLPVTPPIIISNSANFTAETTQYLVSTSLIVCGILSSIQITRVSKLLFSAALSLSSWGVQNR